MNNIRFPAIWKTLALGFLGCISAFANNAIQIENAQLGSSGWQLSNPATNREIEGYASLTSVNIGSPISFFVSTSDPTFHIDVFRTGWYGGLGARLMTTITGVPGTLQPTPDPDPITGMIDCNWQSSYRLSIPTSWTSGIFLARLTGDVSGRQSYIIFVVRNDGRSSDLVFQSSFTTFEAYNFWPGGSNGKSLYDWAPGGRAWNVSFNRPYVLGASYSAQTPGAASGVGAGEYLANLQPGPAEGYPIPAAGFEYNMVRWLEKNGYDVTYITNIDLHENGALLQNHKAYLSVGHNEYWSMPMVQNLQSAMNAGVNAGFLGANTMYWQVRLQADSHGNPDRIIVCYKTDAIANDPMYSTNPVLTTLNFRSAPVNMPEAAIVGVEYVGDPVTGDIVVSNASHWLMNGTGLQNGDHLKGLLGYEVDSYVPGVSPANTVVLASSPIGSPEDVDNPPGFDCHSVECNSNVTWYSTSNYSVFASGSMFWSWGLDDFNAPALRPSYLSTPAQQITENVLSALINSVVITTANLPSAVVGSSYGSYSIGVAGGKAPYTWSATNLPAGIALSTSGVLSGTPTTAGAFSIIFSVKDSAGHANTGSLSLTVQSNGSSGSGNGSGSPSITTATLPYAVAGNPFTQSLAASGGAPPYTWSLATGTLPAGLSLSSAGQITGTPTNAGVFPFTIELADTASNTVTAALEIVSLGPLDSFLSTTMDTGKWCLCVLDEASGSQNPQVSVSQQQGELSITPQSGLSGMNYNGYASLAALNMTDAALTAQVVQAAAGTGYTDTAFALALDTRNWYRFIVEGGNLYFQAMVNGLKSGIAVPYDATAYRYWRFRHSSVSSQLFFETSDTGASWTTQWQTSAVVPVSSLFVDLDAGTWGLDQNTGQAVFANLRWEQNSGPALPYISPGSLSSGTPGSAYAGQLSAVSGASPYQWSLASGSLPAGLTLSSGGALSGVPSTSGTFTFTAEVTDNNALSAIQNFQLTVNPGSPISISTSSLPSGTLNAAYTQTLACNGGIAPYHWAVTRGALPPGLTLAAGGQLSGTPTTAGVFSFTVQAADSSSHSATQNLQVTIAQTYTISGQVTQSGVGLAGVAISLNGATAATTTSTGGYSVTGLISGTYTVSAALSGFVFSPPSQTFSTLASNQTANFSASAAIVTAHGISIKFVGSGAAMGSTESAGVIPKSYWNNAVGSRSSAAVQIVDETNTVTPAGLTWSADNVWSTPITDAPGNVRMMKGYLDTADGNPVTITVSNLPKPTTGYKVYVYFDADNGSAAKTMKFSLISAGVTQSTVVGIDAANQNFNGTFTRANGTAGNCILFTTQSTTFTLTATPKQASDSILRAAVNGMQIIPY